MWNLTSPNGLIRVLVDPKGNDWPVLSAVYADELLFSCQLGIQTNRARIFDTAAQELLSQQDLLEDYALPAGKLARYMNRGREMVLQVESEDVLRLRVYDNGIAFRYELKHHDDALMITGESTRYQVAPPFESVFAQDLIPTYELPYLPRTWHEMDGQPYGMPMLISKRGQQGPHMLFSEAEVLSTQGNYCSCHLIGRAERALSIAFAPEDKGLAMPVAQPFVSPWRITTIVGSLPELIRSHLAHDVNPPSPWDDTNWVLPARSLWAWWAYENGAQLYTQSRDYVDYAAAMGFEAVTLDCGWDANWVPTLCDYARKRKVQIWLWTGMKRVDTKEKAEILIPLWASWGVSGLKIDFFENDSQHTMSVYCMLAELAAQHRLMLNFHGSTKPMGEGRTWPHFITAEGIMGLEHYKWSDMPDSMHNCTVPFLRNVSGPMDYTPLGFSNRNRNTTHAHQLALTVVFESGITHYSLSLGEMEAWPGTAFLRRSKAKYDDVQLLSGMPGDHVVMMRSKGDEYLLGAITTGKRWMEIDLAFLPEGEFEAEIYEDDSKDQMLRVRHQPVDRHTTLKLQLLANGGAALYIAKAIQPLPAGIRNGYMAGQRLSATADILQLADGSERFQWSDGSQGILLLGSIKAALPPSKVEGHTLKIWYSCDDKTTIRASQSSHSVEWELPATSSKWDLCTFPIAFRASAEEGSLKIERLDGGIPAIARLDLVESGRGEGTRYLAKDVQLPEGAVFARKRSGALDAAQLGNGSGLLFPQVDAQKDGWHVLAIEYCGGDSRNISVEVNGKYRVDTYLHSTAGWFFPTWENAEEKELLVPLIKGRNTIRLFNEAGEMSHIRSICVHYDQQANEPGAVHPDF